MIAQIAISRSALNDYVALTKPRIVSLLLLTALGGMFLAADGVPEISAVLLVLSGGALAAGGAHSLNHYLERDIDGRMRRTRHRPVASGRISPNQALLFGIGLNLVAFTLLATLVNPLTALITLSGTLIYVFVYTIGLKRTTPQNIVVGGAAGAVPPMAGWTAVAGSVDLPAVYLFAIIFFWTPPHFWALALLIKDDYARAGIPMLPVVTSLKETKKSILLYALLLVALTMMFFTTQAVGWVYMATSTLLGATFIYYSLRLLRRPEIDGARPMYLYSLLYLAVLFLAMIVDSLVAL
jgi:protoheme IX farnesyltransferase